MKAYVAEMVTLQLVNPALRESGENPAESFQNFIKILSDGLACGVLLKHRLTTVGLLFSFLPLLPWRGLSGPR